MTIWFKPVTVEELNKHSANSMLEHLEIRFTEIGEDYVKATMPVDRRTRQPFGILHGGASVSLAESMGSVAGMLCLDPAKRYPVGIEINANHISAVKEGMVEGICRPVHIGKSTQVWEIKISDERKRLVCISRITLAILDR